MWTFTLSCALTCAKRFLQAGIFIWKEHPAPHGERCSDNEILRVELNVSRRQVSEVCGCYYIMKVQFELYLAELLIYCIACLMSSSKFGCLCLNRPICSSSPNSFMIIFVPTLPIS